MPNTAQRRIHNRIAAVMQHTNRYAFEGQSRLAADAGVSRSAVSRTLSGQSDPSVPFLLAIARALEKETGRHIDVRNIVSDDGTYPVPFVCDLVGCPGCLPEQAYDEEGNRLPEFADLQPGQWSGDDLVAVEI